LNNIVLLQFTEVATGIVDAEAVIEVERSVAIAVGIGIEIVTAAPRETGGGVEAKRGRGGVEAKRAKRERGGVTVTGIETEIEIETGMIIVGGGHGLIPEREIEIEGGTGVGVGK